MPVGTPVRAPQSPPSSAPLAASPPRSPPVRFEAGLVMVAGFDECIQVLRDGDTFSAAVYEGVMGPVMGRTMLQLDDPEHRAQRALVAPAFRSRALDEPMIRSVVQGLVDRWAGRGRATLVAELTFDFPVQVIARILGLPPEDHPRFRRWAVDLIGITVDWDRAVAASGALGGYFAGILADRRRQPADDLISGLAAQGLADEEIFAFLRLLLPAGVETTYRATGTLLYALLTHPDQLAAVRADRSLLPDALEEAIRWEPPVTVILRRATRDTRVGEVPVPAGTDLVLMLGEASRDGRKYVDPHRFDLFRADRQHVGFGFGAHACLGMHLARMEARVAVGVLLDRLPDLQLDPSGPDVQMEGSAFRAPTCLPVTFSALRNYGVGVLRSKESGSRKCVGTSRRGWPADRAEEGSGGGHDLPVAGCSSPAVPAASL